VVEVAMAVGAVSDQVADGVPAVIPDSARVDHVSIADGAPGVPVDEDAYNLRETNLGAGDPSAPDEEAGLASQLPTASQFPVELG
jgi:hypothetical protein